MTIENFMTVLIVVSALSALLTEAVKKIFDEHQKNYHANTLAGICAILVSAVISVLYCMYMNIEVTYQNIPIAIALVLLSWLCSMVGYDKVAQAISQITSKTSNKEE